MLTVWTVCVGDKYSDAHVHTVKRMVERNLGEHRFRCLSDRAREGIDCLISPVDWPGWWQKLYLFHVEHGPALYLDLDVVVTGDLSGLLSERMSMPKNWAQSGHGGCQSSVMSWSGDYSRLPSEFDPSLLSAPDRGNFGYYGPQRLWGDQEFITSVMGEPGGEIHPMQGVYSYKYHCRSGLPDDAKVVCFHGRPKPEEVSDPWVLRYTQI